MLGITRYQWTVLFAAWLGWGFDVFDGLLFNFVAPNCIPDLLGLAARLAARPRAATLQWTGVLTSLLLLGWAAGGVLFGYVGDRLGRTRTLMLTMLLYALGTAACAFAPNLWVLVRVPHRRQPRHRRRVGRRRLDGCRGDAREAPRRGRRAALHRRVRRPVPRHRR